MANVILAYPNRIDSAIVSGGNWSATLPLSNVRNRFLRVPARSTDATTGSTQFLAVLPATKSVHVVGLVSHNLSLAATVRVRLYSDAGATTLVHDSGAIYAWPASYRSGAVKSEYIDWRRWDYVYTMFSTSTGVVGTAWGGEPILWGTDPVGWGAATGPITARAIKIDVVDTGNADGFIEIGRAFIGGGLQPARNMAYGASIGWEPRSRTAESLGGVSHFDKRAPKRVARFTLSNLSVNEGMSAFDMMGAAEISDELYYLWDPADTEHRLRRSFLGHMRALTPVECPVPLTSRTAFEIEELL